MIHRNPKYAIGLATIVLALALTACAQAGYNYPPAAQPSQTAVPAASGGSLKTANDPKLGQILTDSRSMTLYLFLKDTPGSSSCSGSCLTLWPAVTVGGEQPPAADAAITGKIGTIQRQDGTVQVTINDLPLYTFSGDTKPGDVNGQGINEFGGLWYAVNPDGSANTGASGGGAGY